MEFINWSFEFILKNKNQNLALFTAEEIWPVV